MYIRTTITVYGTYACKYDMLTILQLCATDQLKKKIETRLSIMFIAGQCKKGPHFSITEQLL